MTHENTILTNLSEWRPSGQETITVTLPEWGVQITADKCDELGCRLWEIAVWHALYVEELTVQSRAEALGGNLSVLGETLRVVEVDTEKTEALLRSETPTERSGKLLYFEVLLRGTREALLRRFQVPDNGQGKREQTSFVVTHEAAAAIVQSLIGA